jgi:hypothetical protein
VAYIHWCRVRAGCVNIGRVGFTFFLSRS